MGDAAHDASRKGAPMPRFIRDRLAPSARYALTLAAVATLCAIALAADAPKGDAKGDAKGDVKNLLKPTNKPESWRFEQHEGGKGTMAADGDAITFDVTAVDGTDWHVQAFQTDLPLKDGKEYVVTFKAKASANRTVRLNAGIDQDDWHMIGLDEEVALTKEWKDFKREFKADMTVTNKNRVGFQLGQEKGKVWVKEMTLAEK
jgi:hypothetical protein